MAFLLERRVALDWQEAVAIVLEVAEVLCGQPGVYRAGDTHLSDRGNQIAGRWVGERLAEIVAATSASEG